MIKLTLIVVDIVDGAAPPGRRQPQLQPADRAARAAGAARPGQGRRRVRLHLVLRCAPEDPDLGDGAWNAIAAEVMHRTGLSGRGREDQGVRWIAVHHGDNHIHIVATLASQDRRPVWPKNDFYRLGEALRDVEREYGLRVLARADRTAAKSLTRAEMERSAHSSREPDRVILG